MRLSAISLSSGHASQVSPMTCIYVKYQDPLTTSSVELKLYYCEARYQAQKPLTQLIQHLGGSGGLLPLLGLQILLSAGFERVVQLQARKQRASAGCAP